MFELLEKCLPPWSVLLCVGVLAAGPSGCRERSNDDDTFAPEIELIDRGAQALTTGTLTWANGTYGSGCLGHTNGERWSLRISGSVPMDYPALSVTRNDSDCTLALTGLVGSSVYEAASNIPLTPAYQGVASSFATRIAGVLQPVAFYANGKISATTMASNFTITVVYSDDARSVTPSATATYAEYAGSTLSSGAAPPNYTASLGSLVVMTDENDIVDTQSGTVALTEGSQVGQSYVVVAGSVGTTFTAVDSAYAAAGTPVAIAATIPVAAFALTGAQLPVLRTLIISNTSNGVRAYQVIALTFDNPSSCTQGSVTRTATAAVNSGSGNSWSFPGTLTTEDDTGATMSSCCSGDESKTLMVSGFGFSLPTSAQVRGVMVRVRTKGGGVVTVSDKLVQLTPNGIAGGNDKAYATYPGSTWLDRYYGSSTDLWGFFLTPAVVNASSFGLAYRLQKPAFTVPSAYLDLVSITVYYCS